MVITIPWVREGNYAESFTTGAGTAHVGNTPHRHDASQLTHFYKCTNRKCSARNLIIRDSNSPLFYLSQPARIKLCKECKAPMKYVRIDYDRRVFRGKAPTNLQLPDHDELLAYISRIKQSARS